MPRHPSRGPVHRRYRQVLLPNAGRNRVGRYLDAQPGIHLPWACAPCHTPGMAFKVYRNELERFEEYGDEDRFEISEGGVLKIHRQDGTNLYITPGLWASLEETPAPSPGPIVSPDREDKS